MMKIEKYETPEIEITKFEMAKSIMVDYGEETGTGGDNMDVNATTAVMSSEPDGGGDLPFPV